MPAAGAKPMATDIELLPLPEIHSRFHPMDWHAIEALATDYARANVEHHTAAKDAEIKALRAMLDSMIDGGLQQAQSRNEWKDAVIDELITAHVYQKEHDTDPRKAIQDAITWNCQVALDPAVSSDARALVERGLQQAQVVDWRKFPYSIAWCDGLRSVLIECDEYGAAEQIDAIKRYIDTHQSSAPVVGDEMASLYNAASVGFHTSESCGTDRKYLHKISFQSLEALHAYEDAWTKAMVSVRDARRESALTGRGL